MEETKPELTPATGEVQPEVLPQKVETQYTEAQVQEMIKQAEDKQYAKLNQSLTKLGQENKKLRERGSSKVSPEFLTLMEQMATGEYTNDPNFVAKVKGLKEEETRKEALARMEQVTGEAREKIEQKIKDAGFELDDDAFDAVWLQFKYNAFADGKFEEAEAKLDKKLSKMKKPAKEPKPQDVEEAARKILEEQGKLKTETGLPSGVSSSFQEFESRYIKGEIPQDVYEKRARQEGKI